MGTRYSHVNLAERRQIQQMRDAKVPVAVIATRLGRHRFYHDTFRDRWDQEYRGYYCTAANAMARRRRARRRWTAPSVIRTAPGRKAEWRTPMAGGAVTCRSPALRKRARSRRWPRWRGA